MAEKIRSGYATHVGNVRDHNEDNYRLSPELGLWIVADGMGGHESGEVASAMTVDIVSKSVENGMSLTESLVSAHEAVMHAADSDPSKSGMGSTVVVLKINGNRYEVAWVGDSRVYLYSKKKGFKLLTHDHSYVQLLIDNDLIRPEDAKNHPMSHVVNQAIGSSPKGTVMVDTISGIVEAGDRFLLCTDGLTNEISDEGIAKILQHEQDHQAVVQQLIENALAAGGADNVTIVIVEMLAS
ncbi:MAG: PP2C family protein-serine/threonine phosphatase [Gammaproteobacteria bacterium]